MDNWLTSLADNVTQCWGCGIFDKLFQIVSSVGVEMYTSFSKICIALFGLLFFIFTLNALWHNFKGGIKDPIMKDSFLKAFVRAVVALTLLAAGTAVPKTISTVIFEPVAKITLMYSESMINTNDAEVLEKVTYKPEDIKNDGIFSQELRDEIIMIMKTTITQFQAFIHLGITIMDKAFSWSAFKGIGIFIKHILLFFIGLFLAWNFLKLFFKYCCYFADVIIAMAFFAFFFPLSLIMMVFKDIKEAPKWFSEIGKNVGAAQIKSLINAIVTLGSVVITYTVIMMIIARFLSSSNVDVTKLMSAIQDGTLYSEDLSMDTLYSLTLASFVALMYVLNYVFQQIPQITKTIMSTFSVEENTKYSDALASDIDRLTSLTKNNVLATGAAFSGGNKKDDKSDGKLDDKEADK
jgi:hypothetical protein